MARPVRIKSCDANFDVAESRQNAAPLKRTILDVLIIVAAVIGGAFFLKKGDEAGVGKVQRASAPATKQGADTSVRPQAIWGRLDNFKEPIALEPIRSWATQLKSGFTLRVSPDTKLNQPSARVVLTQPTKTPLVLEIQYIMARDVVEMLISNEAIKDKFDGVTILITTIGIAYNQSTFLTLDPIGTVGEQQWNTYYLALPVGTGEIHFSIIGPPPNYNVFMDSCAISLPQLRVAPAADSTPAATSRTSAR